LLAGVLLLILLRRLGDLDFGFYVASGREFFANGIPPTEFLAPLLSAEPLSSQWVLSALAFAGAWEVGGPAGITALCGVCYALGIVLAARAAMARGGMPFAAVIVAAQVTCVVAVRLVERPGCFSVLFLGAVMLLLSGELSRSRAAATVVLFALWPWFHAEWLVGLGAATLLLIDREGLRPRTGGLVALWVALPVVGFALLHPAGARVLLGPLHFLLGVGAEFQVKEYTLRGFTSYPPLLLAFVLGPLAGRRAWRDGRRGEAVALFGLTVLALKIPRALLPLMILAIPALAELVRKFAAGSHRRQVATGAFLLLFAAYAGASRPGRVFGFGIDDRLDSRGIAEVLDKIPKREGLILSEFGMSSMLLVHPSVVRQGIVMDGRQEAYSEEYFSNVYRVGLSPGTLAKLNEPPVVWYAQYGIAFYYETWEGLWPEVDPSGLYRHFSSLGWKTIAWDNSGVLLAAPHVLERHGLAALDPPPNVAPTPEESNDPKRLRQMLESHEARIRELSARGYPTPRPVLAVARLYTLLGDWDGARKALDEAAAQGAHRYATYDRIDETVRAFAAP
jgi:hypothetical protein